MKQNIMLPYEWPYMNNPSRAHIQTRVTTYEQPGENEWT